jgi:serine/threonine protein kinase
VKPENIVLDSKGYCRLTDLGVARVWRQDNAADTSGTPGYMAPEVMCRQNHGVAVDYFALGIIGFEMMLGRRPYLGKNRKEIKEQILARQVQIKPHEIPEDWSPESADFINRLIQRKPINRLGLNGPEEVKNHPWLKNFPWDRLLKKELVPSFQPSRREEDNFDYKSTVYEDPKDPYIELDKENALMLRRDSVQGIIPFERFSNNMVARAVWWVHV